MPCISINLPYGHTMNTVVMSGLVLLVSKKWTWRIAGPSLAASFEPLPHCWNVTNLSFVYMFYFGRCLTKLAQLVPLPYSQGKSTHYSHSCMTYDLNLALRGIFNYRFFPNRFSVCLNLFVFLFLVTLCLECLFSLAWSESNFFLKKRLIWK